MTESFKVWVIGLGVVFIISLVFFCIGFIISPENHISLWDAWSLVLTVITIGTGYQEYYKED